MTSPPQEDLPSSLERCVGELGLVHVGRSGLLFQSADWRVVDAGGLGEISVDPDSQNEPCYLVAESLWRSGLLQRKRAAIVSSRLPKNRGSHQRWFDAVRTAVLRMEPNSSVLLTADAMSADRCVRRMAQLADVPVITVERWLPGITNPGTPASEEELPRLFVLESSGIGPDRIGSIDQTVAGLAATVYALCVRTGGNVDRLLRRRLSLRGANAGCSRQTFLLHDENLTKPKLRQSLVEQGAVDWMLRGPSTATSQLPNDDRDAAANVAPLLDLQTIESGQWLQHWARVVTEPYEDESADRHLDGLLLGDVAARFGDVSTLCRILACDRILASSRLTRSERPVVCFTEVPMIEFPDRTVFRSHLHRWDFVPYGIAIRRSVLSRMGAKRVVYGTEEDYGSLRCDQQPFFQSRFSANGKIDWSEEREWRVPGDVSLAMIGPADAFVFVRSMADARAVAGLSRWPVAVLEPNQSD